MNTLRALLLAALAGLPLSATPQAGEIPEPVLPQGVGVNIHFTRGHARDLDLIAAAGFKFIRMDLGWAGIERRKGEYDWSAYDELTANLDRRGIRALYILDYSNPLYEQTVTSRNPVNGREHKDTASPQHPESVAAFARWAAAAAAHFRGRHVIWEIWNEPNISFWKPKPDVKQYLDLALATCSAVRQADPQATIIAPATSEFPWEFLDSFLGSGVLEYLDAVSVHPYRSPRKSPETAVADYRRLREIIERHTPPARKNHIPIISGEWGYSTHTKGVSQDTQAAFIVRQHLVNLLEAVPLSIWYDWKNDGPDPNENEHNFGTVTPSLDPKPSYIALQTMTRELTGCRVSRRLDLANQNDYALLLSGPNGAQKLAVWTCDPPHTIKLPLKASDRVRAINGTGKPQQLKAGPDGVEIEAGALPSYVDLRGEVLK